MNGLASGLQIRLRRFDSGPGLHSTARQVRDSRTPPPRHPSIDPSAATDYPGRSGIPGTAGSSGSIASHRGARLVYTAISGVTESGSSRFDARGNASPGMLELVE